MAERVISDEVCDKHKEALSTLLGDDIDAAILANEEIYACSACQALLAVVHLHFPHELGQS